jgi:succinyl-diaminopimelate desuccinylase
MYDIIFLPTFMGDAMDAELISKIDGLIEKYTKDLVADTIKLVNIKSVQGKPCRNAPFGKGPKKVLDTFAKMSKKAGFYNKDYKVGVISAAFKKEKPDLGIWIHGDVVPEGDGWNFDPYSAVEYKGCIIGRGVTDNKGQLAAIFNLFKIFKELGVELNYNPAIFLGSNEETGMKDVTDFMNAYTPPALSLVPDEGFPVGYGGKGGMNVTLRSKTPLHSFSFSAGQPDSPGRAVAVFEAKEMPDLLPDCQMINGKTTEISSFTPPRHGSHPDPDGNMITKLSQALLNANLVCDDERYVLEFFKTVSSDIYGTCFGIDTEHEILGQLTVFSKSVDFKDGYVEFNLNIRYPLGITYEKIVQNIENYSETVGFSVVRSNSKTKPYLLKRDSELVKILCKASADVIGEEDEPFTLSGGTYAHKLPNAYVFGTNANLPPDDFPKGRGGAHGIDEAASIERLKRAMKIYARALLLLNETNFKA